MSTFPMFQIYQDFFKKKKMRCPDDMVWLKEYLEKKHLKAYRTDAVCDSINIKKENEVKDWCKGEYLFFWCEKTKSCEKYIPRA